MVLSQLGQDYVSVDIEAGGPSPEYNLCSIGACEVRNKENTFYVELQPMNEGKYVPEAMAVGGFTIESMKKNGVDPKTAMYRFASWLKQWQKPVFVSFGEFDFQYINYYFWHYIGSNPFGIHGVDIKSYYMGYSGCDWKQTTKSSMPKELLSNKKHTHNAKDDAVEQSIIFHNIYTAAEDEKFLKIWKEG